MVVIILGLIAAIAMPRGVSAVDNARLAAGYESYRRLAMAFEAYHAEHGAWPPDDYAGNVPAGMELYLNETEFEKRTPFGGWYDWSTDYGFSVGLGIYQPTAPVSVFDELDARYDDGVRTSGRLQIKRKRRAASRSRRSARE